MTQLINLAFQYFFTVTLLKKVSKKAP